MLGDWQTLYTEDEKMGAGVGPLLLELVGDLTAEAHASLLKTVGSRNKILMPMPTTSQSLRLVLNKGRPCLFPVGKCRGRRKKEIGLMSPFF